MARVVEDELARGTGPDALDPVVDAAARDVDARVTVIARDGRVLADSAALGRRARRVENHGGRPEVQEALAGRVGRAERRSATVGAELLYAAVPIRQRRPSWAWRALSRGIDGDRGAGPRPVARGGRSPSSSRSSPPGSCPSLLSASLGRSLHEIMDTARQFARGNLSARIRVRPRRRARRARPHHQPSRPTSCRSRWRRSRATAGARTPSCRRWTTASSRSTTGAPSSSPTRASSGRSTSATPLGRHYLEVIRQREVGALIEDVLRTGERREAEVELLQLRPRLHDHGRALPRRGGRAARRRAHLQRRDRAPARRAHAPRLRGQRLARAAHAAHLDPRLRRGARGRRGRRAGRPPSASSARSAPTPTAWPPLVEDLLELGRLESGAPRARSCEETRPDEVAEDVVASFAGARHAQGHHACAASDRRRAGGRHRPASGCAASSRTSSTTRSSTRRRAGASRSRRRPAPTAGAGRGGRRRPRHRRRAPRPDLRALLPGGQGAQPRAGRHRARALDREAPGREPRGLGVGGERAGEGDAVHRVTPGALPGKPAWRFPGRSPGPSRGPPEAPPESRPSSGLWRSLAMPAALAHREACYA